MYILLRNGLAYIEKNKNAKVIIGLLLIAACMNAAFELGTHIGEFTYVLMH